METGRWNGNRTVEAVMEGSCLPHGVQEAERKKPAPVLAFLFLLLFLFPIPSFHLGSPPLSGTALIEVKFLPQSPGPPQSSLRNPLWTSPEVYSTNFLHFSVQSNWHSRLTIVCFYNFPETEGPKNFMSSPWLLVLLRIMTWCFLMLRLLHAWK